MIEFHLQKLVEVAADRDEISAKMETLVNSHQALSLIKVNLEAELEATKEV